MDFMKTMAVSLIFLSQLVLANTNPACVPEGGVVVTTNTGTTSCCEGLEPNAAKICDEPAIVDPGLVACSSHASCGNGTGCYPQTYKDLYSSVSLSGPGDEADIIKDQVGALGGAGYPGSGCTHARECASYSCVQGKCENKTVCRYAKTGEAAPSPIKCAGTDKVNSSGLCDTPSDIANPVFPGLNDKITFKQVGKCQFELDDEVKRKTAIAMRSMRAMEWFLATISLNPEEECFDIVPTLRDKVGKGFYEDRKSILEEFTKELNTIENDYKKLIEAKPGSLKDITIHIDEIISEADLASRKTSGYDSLLLMKRSNTLFKTYEKYMTDSIAKNSLSLSAYSKMIRTWKNNHQINPDCAASFYKTWKIFGGAKEKFYNDVQDHWASLLH